MGKKAEERIKKQEAILDKQMGMIEIMNKSLEGTIIKEVRKATAHLNPSDLEDDAIGDGLPSDTQLGIMNPGVTKLLN